MTENSLGATLFDVSDENFFLEKHIRLSQPLEKEEHAKMLLSVASKLGDGLCPKKGCEIILQNTQTGNEDFTQNYEAFLLNQSLVGVVIGTMSAKEDKTKKRQSVYLNSFNVWGENTLKAIDEIACKYSAIGGDVFPKKNFTYDEIKSCVELTPERFSEGMDVAVDVGYLERGGLEERFINGVKCVVPTYYMKPEVSKSVKCFANLVTADKKPPLKRVLPHHL